MHSIYRQNFVIRKNINTQNYLSPGIYKPRSDVDMSIIIIYASSAYQRQVILDILDCTTGRKIKFPIVYTYRKRG